MNPIVAEWIAKAEGDHAVARMVHSASSPHHDAACYHAQQAAEKLMKAVLISHGVTPPRTHNLVVLDEMLRNSVPSWTCPMTDLRILSLAATQFRYPGASATPDDAKETLAAFERMQPRLMAMIRST